MCPDRQAETRLTAAARRGQHVCTSCICMDNMYVHHVCAMDDMDMDISGREII